MSERLRALAEAVLSEEWDPWDGSQGYEPTAEQRAFILAASPEVVLDLLSIWAACARELQKCREERRG